MTSRSSGEHAAHDHDWIYVGRHPIRLEDANDWVTSPQCGASVLFSGTVRADGAHANPTTAIDYEAFGREAIAKMSAIAEHARREWPSIGKLVLWHRVGQVLVEESSVVVAVSAPHRPAAFDVARFCIDVLKLTVPIWKTEQRSGEPDAIPTGTPVASVADAAQAWVEVHRRELVPSHTY
ncbi:molybdenum cofactor biosynthesis protein MoaE [Rhodococcus sp. 15-725-2-2b]|nr:molybdenum cofactor biosynthesis protein MoaE [Rhodococcus sp. 15-725-2-2b]